MAGLGYAVYRVGFWIRETGQALDRLGCMLQGNYGFREQLNRSRTLMNLYDAKPSLGRETFVAPNASIVGQVTLGNNSSVFYGSVLRGDSGNITVGDRTNIQDGTVIRTAATALGEQASDTVIGNKVTIGHMVNIHGSTIGDEALIGMGATLLQGTKVERRAMVAAGAVVAPGTVVPEGEIWGGSPAKFLRKMKDTEQKFLAESAEHYVNVSSEHLKQNSLSLEQIAKSKGLA